MRKGYLDCAFRSLVLCSVLASSKKKNSGTGENQCMAVVFCCWMHGISLTQPFQDLQWPSTMIPHWKWYCVTIPIFCTIIFLCFIIKLSWSEDNSNFITIAEGKKTAQFIVNWHSCLPCRHHIHYTAEQCQRKWNIWSLFKECLVLTECTIFVASAIRRRPQFTTKLAVA